MKIINGIQALRFLAFISIFLCHSIDSCFAWNMGHFSSTLFFVLSAFVLSHLHANEQLKTNFISCIKYGFNRIKKIYPLHIIMIIAFIFLLTFTTFENVGVSEWLKKVIVPAIGNAALLQSWLFDENIANGSNPVSWFLSTILFLYFCFPIIHKYVKNLGRKRSIRLICIIIAVQLITFMIISRNFQNYIALLRYFPLLRIGEYVCGACLYNIYSERNDTNKNYTIIELTVFIIFVMYYSFHKINMYDEYYFIDREIQIVVSLIFVYLFAVNNGRVTKALTNKYFIKLGNLSGYAYLIHYFVIQFLLHAIIALNIDVPIYITVVLGLGISILSAIIYDKIVKYLMKKRFNEHRIINYRKKSSSN